MMRPSRFTEEQIIGMPKEPEAGEKTADVCRKHGISAATSYTNGPLMWLDGDSHIVAGVFQVGVEGPRHAEIRSRS